ncbi:hypothetical protein P6U16_08755 [Rhizobium sp. 32-5/1]|uniref:hypothetical protein n=1 Tax=Rhizobium sp. 32-5/1 TaxID=3019602 RepID=UPI00240DBA1D|nr:hypothetical protein [Rhizobium sp. 32-5/1]WEZ84645.1 hypothetical protein P6U16_08755 [Rhizobium sp. 32-5/1]
MLQKTADRPATLALGTSRVTTTFRDALDDAANRSGISTHEFVLRAAAEKLQASGRHFSGLFSPGDVNAAR